MVSGSAPGALKLTPDQVALLRSEAARVYKTQLTAASQTQAHMRMGGQRIIRGGDQQPSSHAEMHNPLSLRRSFRRVQAEVSGWQIPAG